MPHVLDPEKAETVAHLTRAGVKASTIAYQLNCSPRTVQRYRVKTGVAHARPKPLTDQQIEFMRLLIEDECPLSEIARTIGCTVDAVQRLFPFDPDKPRQRGPVLNKTQRELASRLGLL